MARTKPVIGWREWVVVPELSLVPIKAKIDTGARTSALHAFDLSVDERSDGTWANFEIHPTQRSLAHRSRVSHPVHAFRNVKSSTGHSERRPVIRTVMKIAGYRYRIDLTLTSRDEMGFRMLLGRAALRRRFVVDPGSSFLLTKTIKETGDSTPS